MTYIANTSRGGTISTLNSSTTSLDNGQTFTGTGEDVSQFGSIVCAVKTDQSGVLYIEFSPDNTNWDSSLSYSVDANVNEVHRLSVTREYLRIRFTNNSGSNQTYFRLQTTLGNQNLLTSSLNSTIQSDADAIVSRSIQTGSDPRNTYVNLRAPGYVFSTYTPLTASQVYTSDLYPTSGYSQIQTELYSDSNGTLVGRWYSDSEATKLIRTFTRPYDSTDSYVYFSAPVFGPYIRYTYTNSATAQNEFHFGLRFNTQAVNGQILGLEDFIPSGTAANLGRNVIVGRTDGGDFINVPVTPEGHLEVAMHEPLLPFGSIHTESITPVLQTDAVYGLNSSQVYTVTSGSGIVSASDSMFICKTGTTQYSQAVLESRKRLKYRPGQGILTRFTTLFTEPTSFSYQGVGLGHAEDGVYISYASATSAVPELGVLYVNRGVRSTYTLTVSAAASVAGNTTVTLNGVAYTIPVTNSSNIQRTVYELSSGDYGQGWNAYPAGATVVFVRGSAGVTSGTFSFGGGTTNAGGYMTVTKAGAASTDTFIPQSTWNGDKLDGTGASGATIDPTKLNIWQISFGYLGTDAIVVKNKIVPPDGNNSTWVTAHTIALPNTLTRSVFGNPSFPFTMFSYSAGSTADLMVKTASFAGFIEGKKGLHGPRASYVNNLSNVGATNYHALFTILNPRFYNGRTNQTVINILNIVAACKHTSPVSLYIIKNGSLVGNPNFQPYSPTTCALWDTAATTVTFSTNDQLVYSEHLGDTGNLSTSFETSDYNFEEFTIQPGEYITLATRASTGTNVVVIGSLNTREDV